MKSRNMTAIGLAAVVASAVLLSAASGPGAAPRQTRSAAGPELDRKVQAFLDANARGWRDMNVPEADGRILYDLVLENKYTRALEIGTSTGHSGIWIAWALSKTGGRLVTVEIDGGRYREAVANFREAGLDPWIDARLADAHELVPALAGPFDFVFCDADKDWYKNYFVAVLPKLTVGGAFVAHNVSRRMRRGGWGSGDFVEHVLSLPFMETTFREDSWSGISVSVKRADK
ncbi:MAG TPA: class I SAM-dependent methyltransferase [Candidatus Aminicenantes bacterium]|nr:class I SAM-dependent methyltransferase [Candidatus Aminicenantes bacterium]